MFLFVKPLSGPKFVIRDVRFINSSLENVTVSGKPALVFVIAYEISGLTDAQVDIDRVKGQFHRAIMELLTPDESALIVVVKNSIATTTSTPAITTPKLAIDSTVMTTIASSTTMSSIPAIATSPAASTTIPTVAAEPSTTLSTTTLNSTSPTAAPMAIKASAVDPSTSAAQNLILHTLAGADVHKAHTSIFFENIVFMLRNATDLDFSMEGIRQLWLTAVGKFFSVKKALPNIVKIE